MSTDSIRGFLRVRVFFLIGVFLGALLLGPAESPAGPPSAERELYVTVVDAFSGEEITRYLVVVSGPSYYSYGDPPFSFPPKAKDVSELHRQANEQTWGQVLIKDSIDEPEYRPSTTAAFALKKPGQFTIQAFAPGYTAKRVYFNTEKEEATRSGRYRIEKTVELTRPSPSWGRVVDAATKEPIAGAYIRPVIRAQSGKIIGVPHRKSTTDTEGRWADLSWPNGSEYTVSATGYPDRVFVRGTYADYNDTEIVFRMGRAVSIFGSVRDEDGKPPAVRPIYLSGGGVTRKTITGIDGSYRFDGLAPGRYYVTKIDYENAGCFDKRTVLVEDGDEREVSFPGEGGQLSGRVTVAGQPVPGYILTLWRNWPHTSRLWTVQSASTDSDGYFKIAGIPPGIYRVDANWSKRGPRAPELFRGYRNALFIKGDERVVRNAEHERFPDEETGEAKEPAKPVSLTGTVYDDTTALPFSGKIDLRSDGQDAEFYGGGRYAIAGIERGEQGIAVLTDGWELSPGQPRKYAMYEDRKLDLYMRRKATIAEREERVFVKMYGRLLDADDGTPLPEAKMQFYLRENEKEQYTVPTDLNGKYVAYLPAGSYTIRTYPEAHELNGQTGGDKFELPPGNPVEIDFRVPKKKPGVVWGVKVKGRLLDAATGESVTRAAIAQYIKMHLNLRRYVFVDDDGRFELDIWGDTKRLRLEWFLMDGYSGPRFGDIDFDPDYVLEDGVPVVTIERTFYLTRGHAATSVMKGRVTDRDTGEPVAGAEILLNSSSRPSAVADGDGRYELPVAPGPREIRVNAKADGYITSEALKYKALYPSEVYEFDIVLKKVLENSAVVYGKVTDADTGRAIPHAKVYAAIKESNYRDDAETDRRGEFSIAVPPGIVSISSRHFDYFGWSERWDFKQVLGKGSKFYVEIALAKSICLYTGKVTDAHTGETVYGAKVTCEDIASRDHSRLVSWLHDRSCFAYTDAAGVYRIWFKPVPSKVGVAARGYESEAVGEVKGEGAKDRVTDFTLYPEGEKPPEETPPEETVEPPVEETVKTPPKKEDPKGQLVVTVLDAANGKPFQGVRVDASYSDEPDSIITGADGRAEFTVRARRASFSCYKSGYPKYHFNGRHYRPDEQVREGETFELVVRLRKFDARLFCRTVDAKTGIPIDASVRLIPLADAEYDVYHGISRWRGGYGSMHADCLSGDYYLVASAEGYEAWMSDAINIPPGGDLKMEVPLIRRAGGGLKVKATVSVIGMDSTHTRSDGRVMMHRIGFGGLRETSVDLYLSPGISQGRAIVTLEIPPGDYLLTAWASGYRFGIHKVSVPVEGEAEFAIEPIEKIGKGPLSGGTVYYNLPNLRASGVVVDVLDADGQLVTKALTREGGSFGHYLPPGEYSYRVKDGFGWSAGKKRKILEDSSNERFFLEMTYTGDRPSKTDEPDGEF